MSAPAEIDPALLKSLPLPRLGGESDKDARGRMLVVAGGADVPGAAVLTGVASLRVGAGKLQMAATAAYASPLAFAVPEARVITVAGTTGGDIAASAADTRAPLLRRTDAVVVGSGDVLAGVIGGLLARGAAPATAAIWGVYLHGRAGAALSARVGPLGFLARELLGEIPRALAQAPQ